MIEAILSTVYFSICPEFIRKVLNLLSFPARSLFITLLSYAPVDELKSTSKWIKGIHPSYDTLERDANMRRATISKSIKELEKAGLIKVFRTPMGVNQYWVIRPYNPTQAEPNTENESTGSPNELKESYKDLSSRSPIRLAYRYCENKKGQDFKDSQEKKEKKELKKLKASRREKPTYEFEKKTPERIGNLIDSVLPIRPKEEKNQVDEGDLVEESVSEYEVVSENSRIKVIPEMKPQSESACRGYACTYQTPPNRKVDPAEVEQIEKQLKLEVPGINVQKAIKAIRKQAWSLKETGELIRFKKIDPTVKSVPAVVLSRLEKGRRLENWEPEHYEKKQRKAQAQAAEQSRIKAIERAKMEEKLREEARVAAVNEEKARLEREYQTLIAGMSEEARRELERALAGGQRFAGEAEARVLLRQLTGEQ